MGQGEGVVGNCVNSVVCGELRVLITRVSFESEVILRFRTVRMFRGWASQATLM